MASRSGAARPPRAPHQGALFAQALLMAAVSARWAFGVTPKRWLDDHCGGHGAEPFVGALTSPLVEFVQSAPIAAVDTRFDLAIFVAVLGLSVVVCRGGLSLFRGPSRSLASVIAALLASESAWALVASTDAEPAIALTNLGFSVITMLGVFAIVQALVRHGKVTGRAFVYTTAAAVTLASIDLHGGVVLGGLMISGAVTRRFKGRRRSVSPIPWPTVLILSVMAAAVVSVAAWDHPPWMSSEFVSATHVHLQPERLLHPPVGFPPRLYLPACALLIVLIAPLRWRGGLTIIVITTACIVVTCRGEPLGGGLPAACLLSVCAGGWIWLAGTITKNVALARVFSAVASVGLLVWAEVGAPWTDEARLARPTASLPRLVERGLAAPRDVALVMNPSVRAQLRHLQRTHGVRPDLEIVSPDDIQDDALISAVVSWNNAGQRILSDSFSLGGRWDPLWAIESGLLYWFIFDSERALTAPSISSTTSLKDLPPTSRALFALMLLERARYRRSLRRYELAGRSLEVIDPALLGLSTIAAAAERTRIPSNYTTMLTPIPTEPQSWSLDALIQESHVEAGDMLFHLGSLEQGETILYRAGLDGTSRAWGPLLRWLAVSGQRDRTRVLYSQLMSLPEGTCAALGLLTRGPHAEVIGIPDVETLLEAASLASCDPAEVFAAKLLALTRR